MTSGLPLSGLETEVVDVEVEKLLEDDSGDCNQQLAENHEGNACRHSRSHESEELLQEAEAASDSRQALRVGWQPKAVDRHEKHRVDEGYATQRGKHVLTEAATGNKIVKLGS